MPPLGKMILRRLFWVFPVAFGVVTMTFFMARVLNGDPTELYAPPEATDALRAAIRARRRSCVVSRANRCRRFFGGELGAGDFPHRARPRYE